MNNPEALKRKVDELLAEVESRQVFRDGSDEAMVSQLKEAIGFCRDQGWSFAEDQLTAAIKEVEKKTEP
jgi:hypothetical protein